MIRGIMNTGGRNQFAVDITYRIMEIEGCISKETYHVETSSGERFAVADRKGHIALVERGSNRHVKVHSRRVLPISIDGHAPVIDSCDKYIALCPNCGKPQQIAAETKSIVCACGTTSKTKWLGDKPMVTETETKKPTTEKKARPVKEQYTPNFDELVATPNCTLYRKANVNFDHPGVEVISYCLIFVDGDSKRKYCFNTYNGTTGKRGEPLHVAEFVEDKPIAGAKKPRPWYAVKDADKTKAKLEKDGYELVT